MNKKVKRALGSVLASAMFMSSMTVATVATLPFAVTSVYAATTDWTFKADDYSGMSLAAGDVVVDNDYATVYVAQALTVGGNKCTNEDYSFTSHFKTSGSNTVIDGTSYRLCFKIVTKQSTRISAIAGGGTKNAIFVKNDDDSYTNLTGNCGNNVVFYADVEEAGKTVYIGNGSTNNSMYAVKLEQGPHSVDVTTKLTIGNAGTTLPAGTEVTIAGNTATVAADGTITYNGKTNTSYTVAYVKDGITYSADLVISEDGTTAATLNLPVTAGNTGVTVKTADGSAVVGKKVTLTRIKGAATPVVYTAVTDADGVASFDGIEFESYDVAIAGYTSATTKYQPTESAPALSVADATAIAYPALPSDASASNLYVGYASTDSIKSYDSVQDAVDAATAGQTIYIAANKYVENVYIDKALNLVGGTEGTESKATITFNDSQGGNDSYKIGDTSGNKVRFHGDTVEITAASGDVSFKNIRIENTAEADLGVTVNATALGAYGSGKSCNITLDNCEIIATRDTIYTGSSNATNTWTINNSKIGGFQDVVCGTGTVDINDCAWALTLDSDARFLVPNSGTATVMTATNLTIIDETTTSFTKNAFLGRIWGDSTGSITQTQAIVDGYHDLTGKVPALDNTTYFSAYDNTAANKDKDGKTLADCNWLVRASSSDDFISTNDINVLDSQSANDEDGDYRLVAKLSQYAVDNASDINEVGVVVSDGSTTQTITSDTVYTVGDNASDYYFVAYVKGAAGKSLSVKGVLDGTDGKLISSQTSTATVAAAATQSEVA